MAKATDSKAGTGKTGTSQGKTGAATAKKTGASAPVSPSAAKTQTKAEEKAVAPVLPVPPAASAAGVTEEPGATGTAADSAPAASAAPGGPDDANETVQVSGLPTSEEQSALAGGAGAAGEPAGAGDGAAVVGLDGEDGAGAAAGVTPEPAPPLRFLGMGRFPPDWAQTRAVEPVSEPVKSLVWGLPEVTEFPAELTLVNQTPARVRVLSLATRVLPWATLSVQCETAEQYEALGRELSNRARSCRWGSDEGVQVKHVEN